MKYNFNNPLLFSDYKDLKDESSFYVTTAIFNLLNSFLINSSSASFYDKCDTNALY